MIYFNNIMKIQKQWLFRGIIVVAIIAIGLVLNVLLRQPQKPLNVFRVQVDGMTCESCEHTIMTALKQKKGIGPVEIDHVTGKGRIKYKADKVTESDILEVIKKSGYVAKKGKPATLKVIDYNIQFNPQ